MYGEETTKENCASLTSDSKSADQGDCRKSIINLRRLLLADHAITIAETSLHGMNWGILLKHLGHVALAAVSMTALNRCTFSSALRRFRIGPDAKTLFDDFAGHSREV